MTTRRAPAGAKQIAGHAVPLAHRQRHVLEHRQAAEQRVDLEGAREAALDALRLRQAR